MKILIILLLIVLRSTIVISADKPNPERDSILLHIESIKDNKARLEYIVSQQHRHIHATFARELVDLLYEESRKLNDKEREMIALNGYFSIARNTVNLEQMKIELDRIEQYAYTNNLYDDFFRTKRSYIAIMASNGHTEWAIDEASKMETEAAKLNSSIGVVSAQIAMIQAYKFMRDINKTLEMSLKVLQSNKVEQKDRIPIYLDLYNSYRNKGKHQDALKYLGLYSEIINTLIAEDNDQKANLTPRLLYIESMYADSYMSLKNYKKAEEHLIRADKYYTPDCLTAYFVLYHSTKAAFLANAKEWDLCIIEIDKAIKRFDKEQPLFKIAMMTHKTRFLEKAGRLKLAVNANIELLATIDSINQAFLQKQETAIKENYRWESGLVESAKNAYIMSLAMAIFVAIIFIVALGFVTKLCWTHYLLSKTKKEAEKSERKANEANELKNSLLKNISNEISAPISRIRETALKTSSAPIGTESYLIKNIERESAILIRLLDLVVRHSKLETGVINFNIRQTDILGICYESIKLVDNLSDNNAEINFTSYIKSQLMLIDHEWMLLCLSSALLSPPDNGLSYKISFTIKYSSDVKMVVMEIIGSPLADLAYSGQIQSIQNQVNELFIKVFDGKYDVQISKLHPIVTISLPHKEIL